jgi:hypothetical protein
MVMQSGGKTMATLAAEAGVVVAYFTRVFRLSLDLRRPIAAFVAPLRVSDVEHSFHEARNARKYGLNLRHARRQNIYLYQGLMGWRRGRDSNPRYPVKGTTVFETAPIDRSGTSPPRL